MVDILKDYSPDRSQTKAMKWHDLPEKFGASDLVPVWIADMDFAPAKEIKEALQNFVEEQYYGYYSVPESYYTAIVDWTKAQYNYETKAEWYRFAPGVCTGIAFALHAFTNEGDKVLIQNPVYNPFRTVIEEANRTLVMQDLLGDDVQGYTINFEAMEDAFKHDDIKAILFCSPQNPTGRVWTKEELTKVVDLCKAYDVLLLSDEIHRDLIMPGHEHIAIGNIDPDYDNYVLFASPSKTFNLAGLNHSFLVVPNAEKRVKLDTFLHSIHLTGGQPAGYIAAEAAYTHGGEWLDAVNEIIWSNYNLLKDTIQAALPEVTFSDLEGTYLAWLDLGAYMKSADLEDIVQNKAKLAVNYGTLYWPTNADDTHIRINLATRPEIIETAAKNLVAAIKG
ncbi:MalY/PatB family protein [Aerococcus sp. 1KP-2016]|uniref:MalY/PatB family protein n=1 Tax=Aerococcus sp. 1KP-2016 TaxID=1981982 RepID=UPI000B991B75|nr:PatB family C-S lyase [Aerococcus sp. 1KP-2016]OYQ67355.1 aminotransferase [Aerococcus sp. 1KP-2016]